MLRQALVLATVPDKERLIQSLRQAAGRLIYHDSACFVVSQIVYEGLTADACSQTLIDAVHEFMEMTLADAGDHHNLTSNLSHCMTHRHSNHAFKMWVVLLATSAKPTCVQRLNTILEVVQHDFTALARHPIGVRTVDAVLQHFLCDQRDKVEPILQMLARDSAKLHGLICNEMANHVIQTILQHMPDEVHKLIRRHFNWYAQHDHANYVLQTFITSPACGHYLISIAEIYLARWGTATPRLNSMRSIRRIILESLHKQGTDAALMTARRFESNPVSRQRHTSGGGWHTQGWRSTWQPDDDRWSTARRARAGGNARDGNGWWSSPA